MSKLNLHQKNNFKESFNSDKSRQEKFGQSPNFLLIMDDIVKRSESDDCAASYQFESNFDKSVEKSKIAG